MSCILGVLFQQLDSDPNQRLISIGTMIPTISTVTQTPEPIEIQVAKLNAETERFKAQLTVLGAIAGALLTAVGVVIAALIQRNSKARQEKV